MTDSIRARWVCGLAAALLLAGAADTRAQTLKETSEEARFQIDLKVPDAALAAVMPRGFTPDVATSGPAKDCNLRLVFIDRATITGPDNMPIGKGTNQLVYLVAPVKDPAGQSTQLVIGGLTVDPADAPGPFGNYIAATSHSMQRGVSMPATGTGPILETQDWAFRAATGEHFEMHIKFERGAANLRPTNDRKFYSAKDPARYQISREEQVLDILRNVTTTPPDRVKEFSLTGGGGAYAALLPAPLQVLSWDNILWIRRSVLVP